MATATEPQSTLGHASLIAATPHLHALHRHLTKALLKPVCPDIQLKAFHRIYSLHRIFLVQSTFFNSLLNGDFQEARAKTGVWKHNKAKKGMDEIEEDNAVELHFDDPNITRPAFEYCIATLYGAAPTLVLPSWCCPTPEAPLTTQFQVNRSSQSTKSPSFSSTSTSEGQFNRAQHPATPRFLLSLIASATYLGIPSVASQAVTLVLCSITPYTVSQYLRFSLGSGIVGAHEAQDRQEGQHSHWDWELEGPVWGMEGLSKECNSNNSSVESILDRAGAMSMQADEEEDEEGKAGNDHSRTSSPSFRGIKESSAESFLPSFMSEKENIFSHQGRFYYGAPSDKIGEVCACWLLRWGADVLLAEEQMQVDEDAQDCPLYISTFTLPRGVLPMSQSFTPGNDSSFNITQSLAAPHPTVWCHPKLGGIPAAWVRTIISSDSFWIRSEWDRYDMARRVVAMRRGHRDDFVEADENVVEAQDDSLEGETSQDTASERHGKSSKSTTGDSEASLHGSVDEEDEEEYAQLFSQGIYYTHMTFEELSAISNQICPSSGSTYVNMMVLQSALWAQSELKNLISSKDISKVEVSTPSVEEENDESSSVSRKASSKTAHTERELGLVSPEADFASAIASTQRKGRKSDAGSTSTMLGGMRPLMLMGASSKAKALENLLDKRFYAVPSDDTVRIGENLSSLVNADSNAVNEMEIEEPESGGPSGLAAAIDNQTLNIAHDAKRASMNEYFGVNNAVMNGRGLGVEYGKKTAAHTSRDWTGYEPMRLGAEFYAVDRLKEKERMYSPSFFYAGSIWNLYLQIIKKPKGLQLGIYLHRQNPNDPLPNPSFPSDLGETSHFAGSGQSGLDPHTPRRHEGSSQGATLTGGTFYSSSPSTSNNAINTLTPMTSTTQQQETSSNIRYQSPLSPSLPPSSSTISLTPSPTSNCIISNAQDAQYADQRRILRAYFSIHCPSPLGTSLTKFSSRPDNFSLSQSWGWKSSSLLGAVYLTDHRIGSAESQISPIFRCIVTVGIV
jgi:hypothetical protein